ncbi:UNKNOWN [Stylonychia lemnae]|uniref:Uncharacterized protein n=1 Tax=Stylonychia lemnae TaxID=5949 RepID=A0A078AD24_STYLE|nr:UNKNOWN [Stylonychia lemnae]|eukprot:CDW80145.1 UNKNOWN [Stylonychia lemnae]
MSLWIMENVLDEDFSNIYEAITNEIEDGQLWGKEEDQTYLQISTEDWDKQVELYPGEVVNNNKEMTSNKILQRKMLMKMQFCIQLEAKSKFKDQKYEIDMRNKLAQLDEVKGQKGKRIAIMREKIMADNELYDEEIEQEEEQPDQNYSDDELKQDQDKEADQDIEGRVGEFGEIYATTSSGEDEIEDENGVVRPKRLFIPRAKQQAYKHGEGQVLRIKQKNPMRFTKGTDPRTIAKLNFMVDDSIACPQYLPLDQDDAKITVNTMLAAINQDHVPLSEHIKKENFYMSFQAFNQAVQADPALIKVEINSKLEQFDQIYGLLKTQKEKEADKKFTQGDFRRFCSIFYYVTRRLLKQTEFLMERERKKRMMPKHLLAAAVLSGILPLSHLPKDQLSKSEMVQLENALSQKSPAKQKQYRPRLPNSQIPQQPRLPPPSQNPNNVNAKVQGQNNRRR